MFLLDTNVISDLRRPQRVDPKLLAWAQSMSLMDQYLSAVTIMELEQGVLARERTDPAQGRVLREWLDGTVRSQFAGRIVAFDEPVALCCAFLHVPNPKSYRDAMIGACAMVHAMTLVTHNTRDFIHMVDAQGKAIKLIDPYL